MKYKDTQNPILTKILTDLYQTKLPASLAKKLVMIVMVRDNAANTMTAKITEFMEQFGVKDESGKLVVNESGNATVQPEYVPRFNDLMSTEFSTAQLTMEDIDLVGGISGIEMRALIESNILKL